MDIDRTTSRPTKEKPWEYNFYVDLEGYTEVDNVKKH